MESWSGVCIVELNCNNTQYMYIQEMNVYLFLRYTKNMVTRNISFKSMKNFCVINAFTE